MFDNGFGELLENRNKRPILCVYPIINDCKQYMLHFHKYQFYYVMIGSDVYIYYVNSNGNNHKYDLRDKTKNQQTNKNFNPKPHNLKKPKLYGNEIEIK